MISKTLDIPISQYVHIQGDLVIPTFTTGTVIFAHGSGSSRLSPRNKYVASKLHKAHISTLMLDLLTLEEDETYANRFDISVLAERLVAAYDYCKHNCPELDDNPIGIFGASTGAAAALIAATQRSVAGIVSRGGRVDLASGNVLEDISCPVLLIVGDLDSAVVTLNENAKKVINRPDCILEIIPGASHLFEEPGKLDIVSKMATEFFARALKMHHHNSREE